MTNVIPIPRNLPSMACGKCEHDFFRLANDNGKLIAVCANCEAPTVPLGCCCLKAPDDKKMTARKVVYSSMMFRIPSSDQIMETATKLDMIDLLMRRLGEHASYDLMGNVFMQLYSPTVYTKGELYRFTLSAEPFPYPAEPRSL